jgi:hypothetical protein
MIAIVGAVTYHYIKDMYMMEERNLEADQRPSEVIDKY